MDASFDTALHIAAAIGGVAACLAGCVRAFETFPIGGAPHGPVVRAIAAMLIGVSVWAEPLLAQVWPAQLGLAPDLEAASLALALAASCWALFCRKRCRGLLRVIGPGAILGGGITVCNAANLLALRGPADLAFDDMPFSLGVTLASTAAVAAFIALSRLRGRARLTAASLCVALGAAASTAFSRLAVQVDPLPGPVDSGAAPQWAMGLAALLVVSGVATALDYLTRADVATTATRAQVWRGSRRPFPSPRRAGTGFLRPAPARSVAARAAAPGRPAPPAG